MDSTQAFFREHLKYEVCRTSDYTQKTLCRPMYHRTGVHDCASAMTAYVKVPHRFFYHLPPDNVKPLSLQIITEWWYVNLLPKAGDSSTRCVPGYPSWAPHKTCCTPNPAALADILIVSPSSSSWCAKRYTIENYSFLTKHFVYNTYLFSKTILTGSQLYVFNQQWQC